MWKTIRVQLNKSNIFGSFTILEYTKPRPLAATIMRLLTLNILFTLFCLTGDCQTNDIMQIALKDRSNFKVMTALRGKLPSKFILLQTTKKWDTQNFVLDSVDLENPQIKKQMESGTYDKYNKMYSDTYANPYLQTYLFTDTLLSKKIDKTERLQLKKSALKKTIKKVSFARQNFLTVSSYHKVNKGYFMTVSEPVFTSDKKYAFISFDIYNIGKKKWDNMNQYYFGQVTIVYQKQKNNTWKKIVSKDHVIL